MRAFTIRTRTIHSRNLLVKVDSSAGSISVPWNDTLDEYENHRAAFKQMVNSLAWGGTWVQGELDLGTYIFVKYGNTNDCVGIYHGTNLHKT